MVGVAGVGLPQHQERPSTFNLYAQVSSPLNLAIYLLRKLIQLVAYIIFFFFSFFLLYTLLITHTHMPF